MPAPDHYGLHIRHQVGACSIYLKGVGSGLVRGLCQRRTCGNCCGCQWRRPRRVRAAVALLLGASRHQTLARQHTHSSLTKRKKERKQTTQGITLYSELMNTTLHAPHHHSAFTRTGHSSRPPRLRDHPPKGKPTGLRGLAPRAFFSFSAEQASRRSDKACAGPLRDVHRWHYAWLPTEWTTVPFLSRGKQWLGKVG